MEGWMDGWENGKMGLCENSKSRNLWDEYDH
jgi:hypothetical protein